MGDLPLFVREADEEIQVLKAKVAELELDVISRDLLLQSQEDKIAELEKENAMLKRVEKIFNDSPDLTFETVERLFKSELDALKLEQQAKGLEEMLDVTDTWSVMNTYAITVDDIYEQMQELRKQAAKLKEQTNV